MKKYSFLITYLSIIFLLNTCFLKNKVFSQTIEKKPQFSNDNFIPNWCKSAVWYQIFPDRFSNGDIKNDPLVGDQYGTYPFDTISPWQMHPWTSDWYQLQDYEKKNGKDVFYNIQRRRYGGDIQGIINKLDYLQSLGVNAIYLNPIFWAPSSHKYDAICYHHVDPCFGPDPEGDKKIIALEDPSNSNSWRWTAADKLFLSLINEVHNRKMKIILDGVFNHMGQESFAFKDVVKNQSKSKYKFWFEINSFEDKKKGTKFSYDGWFGVKQLPEINEDEEGIVNGPREYIFSCTSRWMNPDDKGTQYGIDGWRLDVAFCISHLFWKDWRKWVKNINPEAYLTGEVIINEPIEKLRPYLEGDEFDAIMNYNFAFNTCEFFMSDKTRIKPSVFDKNFEDLRNNFPSCIQYSMQNLFDSHDTNRLSSMILNSDSVDMRDWGKYFGFSQAQNNNKYQIQKPDLGVYQIQKLCVAFQMTYIGAPMIYYGDEVGMWGANDPCCRKPMIWNDINYDSEKTFPDQSKWAEGFPVKVNQDLLDYYKKMIALHNDHKSLQIGSYKTILVDDEKNIFAYERKFEKERIIVVINNSLSKKDFQTASIGKNNWLDLMNDKKLKWKNLNALIEFPPKSVMILKMI